MDASLVLSVADLRTHTHTPTHTHTHTQAHLTALLSNTNLRAIIENLTVFVTSFSFALTALTSSSQCVCVFVILSLSSPHEKFPFCDFQLQLNWPHKAQQAFFLQQTRVHIFADFSASFPKCYQDTLRQFAWAI